MGSEVTFACVYRTGGDYSADYVRRLRAGIAEHFKAPFRFVCLTNADLNLAGVETVKLKHNWRGWWSKIELFRPELFVDPVVYLDLDTMIVRDVTDIFGAGYGFAACADWKFVDQNGPVLNSCVMCWDPVFDFSHIYKNFEVSCTPRYEQNWQRWGDQGYIQDQVGESFVKLQDMWPDRFVHYKNDVRPKGRVPDGASVVCFSGRPRPHQINWSLPL